MQIHLKYFAALREALGIADETLTLPDTITTIGALRQHLTTRGEVWSQALGEGRAVRMAQNQDMAQASTTLLDKAEVAFFPPVTGG